MIERNAGAAALSAASNTACGVHLGRRGRGEATATLMGDAVNIAARLEGIAAPGAVASIRGRLSPGQGAARSGGERSRPQMQLKNIAEPVRVYSLEVGVPRDTKPPTQVDAAAPGKSSPRLALPTKPSIAVLAFRNMSGEPE